MQGRSSRFEASATASRPAPTAGSLLQQEALRAGRPARPTGSRRAGTRSSPPAQTAQDASPASTPLQLNAGTAMGEATTMQGVLPLLVGTGAEIYDRTASGWATPSSCATCSGFYERGLRRRARRPAAAAGGQGPRQVVRRVRRRQDRHPARERLLLAQRVEPEGRHRADEADRDRPSATRKIPAQTRRLRRRRPGLRQHVRRRRPRDQPEHQVPAAGLGAADLHELPGGDQGARRATPRDHRTRRRQRRDRSPTTRC